jgi:hypothetical protein
MSSLERIPGLNAELASLLNEEGVYDIAALARADAGQLAKGLAIRGQKRGRATQVPGIIAVKLFIKAAQEKAAQESPEVSIDDIPEAQVDRSDEDIPEAIIEHINEIPSAVLEPAPSSAPSSVESSPTMTPRRSTPSFAGATKPDDSTWKGVERSRFQTMENYAEGGRGIQPLKRTKGSHESAPAKLHLSKGAPLPRTTRRGVLYPWPFKAILGALVALLWRLGLLVTCLALPYYSFVAGKSDTRPVIGSVLWLVGLLLLGFIHLWFISSARCRVCSCHLFYSKRCFKNSRAHLIPGLGYVTSLALHLLLFQWFRCMYCGTAIRLFGASRQSSKDTPSE